MALRFESFEHGMDRAERNGTPRLVLQRPLQLGAIGIAAERPHRQQHQFLESAESDPLHYSDRRAVSGSTSSARRIGSATAATTTALRINATAANVPGSSGWTPNNTARMYWPIHAAAAAPAARPPISSSIV